MQKKKIIILICFLIVLLFTFGIWKNIRNGKSDNDNFHVQNEIGVTKDEKISEDNQTPNSLQPNINEKKSYASNLEIENKHVPFVVQAPLGNWSDPVFQDGCEEASVVMAMGWINGEQEILSQDAVRKIKDIVEFENKSFGYNADTDLSDVQKIFKQLFSYEKISVKVNISSEDIRNEIEKGSIILVPAFGQALGNPNFTKPGPIAHMLVVIGYDQEKKQFITNDPGTKRGENFRYGEKTLFDAIWEYPSGKGPLEIPKKGSMKKGVLVVSK